MNREQFLARISPQENGCRFWCGAKSSSGYGHLRFLGKEKLATHVSWYCTFGNWPDKDLLHTCDNKLCVNVCHLYEGTDVENSRDAFARGLRRQDGMHNANSKLTDHEVRSIRISLGRGTSQKALASFYKVSKCVISGINVGRSWRHIRV